MSDFYKLVVIDGKDFGCVATKKIKPGTLIFSERPDVTALGDFPETNYFKTMMSSFKKLTQNDQKEYMELHNRFGEEPLGEILQKKLFEEMNSNKILPKDLFQEMNLNETKAYSALVLKVHGIYKTNTFGDGVGIKMSRVNHSCGANATNVWDDESKSNELRAVAKIEVGEEICINYLPRSLFMKNLETRQKTLLFQWGFKCTCAICLEEIQNDANHIYERFAELQKKQEMFGEHQNFVSIDITKIRIAGIREMYKIAKEKKPARSHLKTLLEDGLFVATAAYIHAKGSRNFTMLELFLQEGEVFAKAHAKLTKIINGYLAGEIKQRSENCKQWMDQQAQDQYLQSKMMAMLR